MAAIVPAVLGIVAEILQAAGKGDLAGVAISAEKLASLARETMAKQDQLDVDVDVALKRGQQS